MFNYIEWPADEYHRDTGEGGLFVYAAWNHSHKNLCHVDVHALVTPADVMVAAEGPLRREFEESTRRLLQNSFDSTRQDMSLLQVSTVADAVVFLGSTNNSWFDDSAGNYFYATKHTLTEDGKALIELMRKTYGEPTFITYLDT